MKHDIERIKYTESIREGNFLIHLAAISLYDLNHLKKNRGGEKTGFIVSCIDMTAKEGEQEAFCKRIRTKKDARKYYQLLFSYLKNYGNEGLMKVWDEVEKCFNYKVCINKDHTIHPWNVVQHAKSIYENRLEQL